MKYVLVIWNDAHGKYGSMTKEFIVSDRDCLMMSCGILVINDHEGVIIAQDYNVDDGTYRNTLIVPRDYILQYEILREDDDE